MSTEASIGLLIQQAGLLLDIPTEVRDAAIGQINAIGNSYLNIIGRSVPTFFVNQVTGNDAASGLTAQAPLRTMDKALEMTPTGGICFVRLQSDYNFTGQPLGIYHKTLHIEGLQGAPKRVLSFERTLQLIGGTNYRNLAGFDMKYAANVSLVNVRVQMPPLDGGWGNYQALGRECLFSTQFAVETMMRSVLLLGCEVDMPATPFGQLLDTARGPFAYTELEVTAVNAALNGKRLNTAQAAGGTAATACQQLITNLATV